MLVGNLKAVKERIKQAAGKVNRNPDEITLVCVTKEVTPERIEEVVRLGITDIGENRVQEALKKFNILNSKPYSLKWHMIGHLQRNKAKYAVKIFDLIHSLDSIELAQQINKQAQRINKIQDVLIQVNTSAEKTKFGITPEESFSLVREILELKNLRLMGLMTIAPLLQAPEKTRPYFRRLRLLREEIVSQFPNDQMNQLPILSMGMSQDFEIAIEEGANMLRIGTAIFKDNY